MTQTKQKPYSFPGSDYCLSKRDSCPCSLTVKGGSKGKNHFFPLGVSTNYG